MGEMTSKLSKRKSKRSIYQQTFLSKINHYVIASYNIFFLIFWILFFIVVFLELAQIFQLWEAWNIKSLSGTVTFLLATNVKNDFIWLQSYIDSNFSNEIISLLSIIISLLSVIAATFSITFGNYTICSINANLVLKQIYGGGKKKTSTKMIVLMMITPFFMLVTISLQRYVLYMLIFLVAFVNLFYLLDVCLTIFTDNGVKYVVLPDCITRELRQNVRISRNMVDSPNVEREHLLYDSFVQNISCDDYSVDKVIIPSVVFNLIKTGHNIIYHENNKEDDGLHYIYRKTYQFFFDIRKYLYRNTVNKKDFINTYFSLCSDTIYVVISEYLRDQEEFGACSSACIAIFRNIVETMHMNESVEFSMAFDFELKEMLNTINTYLKKNYNRTKIKQIEEDTAVVALNIIFQMEYELKGLILKHTVASSCKYISDVVNLLFIRVFVFFSENINPFINQNGYNYVEKVIKRAKTLFLQLSSGVVAIDYIYQLDLKRLVHCTNCIIHDLYLYIGVESAQVFETRYLSSVFIFIYEAFLRGSNKI